MVNLVSTTTPAASNRQAMTLKALQQRMSEQQAQAAAISRPHVVTSIPQGLGDIANTFFNARREDYLQGQEKNTRDALAKMRAGWGPEGPTPAQSAEYSALDPEEGNRVADQVMQAAQAKATQERGFGHDTALESQREGFQGGQNDLNRGQEMTIAKMQDELTRSGRPEADPDSIGKQPPGWPLGSWQDKGTKVWHRPDEGTFNSPLAPATAAAAGAAADFATNADALATRAANGEGTGVDTAANQLFGGEKLFGKNEIHAAIDDGINQLLTLKGIQPGTGSTEEADLREQFAAKPYDTKETLPEKIRKLKQALTIARGSLVPGREPTVVPGGATPPPAAAGDAKPPKGSPQDVEDTLNAAKKAIANGKDKAAVNKMLKDNGYPEVP